MASEEGLFTLASHLGCRDLGQRVGKVYTETLATLQPTVQSQMLENSLHETVSKVFSE